MSSERTFRRYLVVSADGEMRVLRTSPRLAYNEVVFPLWLTVPVRQMTAEEIRLRLPEMAVPDLEVGDAEEAEQP